MDGIAGANLRVRKQANVFSEEITSETTRQALNLVSGGYVDDEDLSDVIIYTGEGGRGPDLRILVVPDPKKNRLTQTIVPRHSVNFVWQTVIGLTQ